MIRKPYHTGFPLVRNYPAFTYIILHCKFTTFTLINYLQMYKEYKICTLIIQAVNIMCIVMDNYFRSGKILDNL